MKPLRTGIIGLGNMGSFYADRLAAGDVPGATLAAVADPRADRLTRWPDARAFGDGHAMIAASGLDAVVIATPHYAHTDLGIAALEAGLHVLVDKPISVHKRDAERLIAAHRRSDRMFAAMFNQRTDGYFLKIRSLIHESALGAIRRIHWTSTHWFRTHAYYQSSAWRATWAGEGGGVLLNQAPHQLDMLCWLFGLPAAVTGFCAFGRYHDIEVEDDVTAYLEWPGGTHGVFITGTGEAPGTNRLEIAAENGRLVLEQDRLVFHRNEMPMSDFSRTTPELFAAPKVEVEAFEGLDHGTQHLGILRNFAAAIRGEEALIAPAQEGIASVELANAILLSAWEGRRVELPLDAAVFAHHLDARIAASTARKTVRPADAGDMTGSFR
jgi:predicted dehydrogenase